MFDNQLPMCLAITNSARSYQRRANYLMYLIKLHHSPASDGFNLRYGCDTLFLLPYILCINANATR
jgi:hypothetical protein